MNIYLNNGGYTIEHNGFYKEGLFETEQLATLAFNTLKDEGLSQLYMTVLSDSRTIITQADYNSYMAKY